MSVTSLSLTLSGAGQVACRGFNTTFFSCLLRLKYTKILRRAAGYVRDGYCFSVSFL